jgi:8-oxo-dGTP pyrophosphatase MutT (NUDIX family)
MSKVIQSAGGIIYYFKDGEPRYLLIKRQAVSKKIERVAPKGKVQNNEKMQDAALREVSEEAGIPINQMKIKQELGTTQLRSSDERGQLNKDVTYFLIEYTGDPGSVSIQDAEGYIGIYKWATIKDVLGLIYYKDIRELIRKSYQILQSVKKNSDIKKDFLKKLDL